LVHSYTTPPATPAPLLGKEGNFFSAARPCAHAHVAAATTMAFDKMVFKLIVLALGGSVVLLPRRVDGHF